jgi:hypothetical protein
MAATSTTASRAVVINNALVISQLTNTISLQNKEAMESNNLHHQDIEWQIEREEKKKDRTKKLHLTIVNMLKRAAATDKKNKKDKEIAPTCLHFMNSNNVSLAQYELIHQFKESGFCRCHVCIEDDPSTLPGRFSLRQLELPKQLNSFCFS